MKEGLIDKLYGLVKSGYFSLQDFVGVENLADFGGLGISFYGGFTKKGVGTWLISYGVAIAPEFYQVTSKIFSQGEELSDQLRTAFLGDMLKDMVGVTVAFGVGAVLRRIVKRKRE